MVVLEYLIEAYVDSRYDEAPGIITCTFIIGMSTSPSGCLTSDILRGLGSVPPKHANKYSTYVDGRARKMQEMKLRCYKIQRQAMGFANGTSDSHATGALLGAVHGVYVNEAAATPEVARQEEVQELKGDDRAACGMSCLFMTVRGSKALKGP